MFMSRLMACSTLSPQLFMKMPRAYTAAAQTLYIYKIRMISCILGKQWYRKIYYRTVDFLEYRGREVQEH